MNDLHAAFQADPSLRGLEDPAFYAELRAQAGVQDEDTVQDEDIAAGGDRFGGDDTLIIQR